MTTFHRINTHWVFIPAVLVVSGFLLITMGGAIFAAPLTIPLLFVIARDRAGWPRIAAAIIAALTVAETTWALTYVTVEEAKPWIWAIPAIVGLGALAYLLTPDHHQGPRHASPTETMSR